VQGVLHSKCADDPGVDDAARWMDMTMRACDADVVEDWEVDELLSWSTGLDFDDYWKHWHSIATSDLSEAAVCTLFCRIFLCIPLQIRSHSTVKRTGVICTMHSFD